MSPHLSASLVFGLSLDPLSPPVALREDLYRFAPGVELTVLPAVVLHLEDRKSVV